MQNIEKQFKDQVEAYLDASGTDPTTFGKVAMNDPKFIFDLRTGRSPSGRTMDRVIDWMAANPPPEPESVAV